jgi:acyl-CoA synthetase (NDP forming)
MRRTGRSVGRGRTGVVTVSTGEASLIADQAPLTGVDLPPIPASARDAILEALPTMGYVGNPLDPWGADEPSRAYGAVFEAMATSGAYDVLALVHDFPYRSLASEVATANDVARQLLAATRDRPAILPVYVSLTSGEPPPETKALLDGDGSGTPLLRGGLEAFTAIAKTARWTGRRDLRRAVGPWRGAWPALAADRTSYGVDPAPLPPPARSGRALSERDSLAFLATAGIDTTHALAVPDADAAVEAARRLGVPVALKLEAADLWHKSDVGGVALGLHGDDAVRDAAMTMLTSARDAGLDVKGLLVEPMAAPGVELFMGLQRDPLFGSAILVGLGGILAEVIDDVAIRLAPVTPRAAMSMLDDLRGRALLDGVRGRPGVDRAAIAAMLVALGRLGADRPDVLEVDLNPVIASPTGVIAVDALVVLEEGSDAGTD